MRVLALEPYFGGSHKAFLDGWITRSRHEWTLLSLPAYKWKWRMRHAAVTFAADAARLVEEGESWDALFCSDMLNLAEFLGLAPESVRRLPCVAYFHENQLTYPVSSEDERDYTYGFINMTTCLAASRVWFNSAYQRDSFLTTAESLLHRMPDYQCPESVEKMRARSDVQYPGIGAFPPRRDRKPGPLRILWSARWEYDKGPEIFFEAVEILRSRGVGFELSVLGERFRETPAVFDDMRERFRDAIIRWGYQGNRDDYECALAETDVVVSTARHESFGIGIVEALAAGAFPVVPKALAYPEVVHFDMEPGFFYEGGAGEIAGRLEDLALKIQRGGLWDGDPLRGVRIANMYDWETRVPILDEQLERTD